MSASTRGNVVVLHSAGGGRATSFVLSEGAAGAQVPSPSSGEEPATGASGSGGVPESALVESRPRTPRGSGDPTPDYEKAGEAPDKSPNSRQKPRATHNAAMSMTREELQAHLAAQSAQFREALAVQNGAMEASLATQNGAIDARLGAFGERIDQAIVEMRRDRTELKAEMHAVVNETRTSKVHIVTTMVVTGIAVVLGLAAFNATLLSNMTASQEVGRAQGAEMARAVDQLKATNERLDDEQRRRASAPPSSR